MGALATTGLGGLGIVQRAVTEPTPPEWFEVELTTTAPNQTYMWQISAGTAINATTQWGDGTTSTRTAAGFYTHTYANAGVYTVRIQASFGTNGAFNMRPNSDRARLTQLLSPIPQFAGLTNLSNLLNGCTGLTGTIPTDFLRYVTNATNLANMLLGCIRLQLQPDIFGPDPNRFLNQSTSFASAFQNVGTFAGTPQGTAPPIWTYDFGTGTPIRTNAFALNSASLTNWAQIPAAWGGPLV